MRRAGETLVRLRVGKEHQQKTAGRRHGVSARDHQRTRSAFASRCRRGTKRRFGRRVERFNKRPGESPHRTFTGTYFLISNLLFYAVVVELGR